MIAPGIVWRDEVTSTNAEVAALARDGAPDGAALVADHQSAGRGRQGRSWEAPTRSSLLMSVLLRPAPPLAWLAAGLAAVDACAAVTPNRFCPELKWPNDLMAPQGKVGGILVDLVGTAAVVGLGLNVDWTTPLPPGGADLLGTAGVVVERAELAAAFLGALLAWRDRPRPVLLEAYRARCATLGRTVRVQLVDGVLTGRAEAVDDDGRLLVKAGDAFHTVSAGDVVHLR